MMSVLENQEDPDIKWEIHTPQERRLAIMGRVLGRPGIRLDQIADAFAFRSRRYTRIYTS